RGDNGGTDTVLPPEAREVWWRTGKAPDEERDAHPAPGVGPARPQGMRLNSPEPAILAAKQNQTLSNGWGSADGLGRGVAPPRPPRAAIDKIQGTIVRTHIDELIQQCRGRVDPSLRLGAPAFRAIDGVQGIYKTVPGAEQ